MKNKRLTGEKLSYLMNDLPDAMIAEAISSKAINRKRYKKKIILVASALCLFTVVGVTISHQRLINPKVYQGNNEHIEYSEDEIKESPYWGIYPDFVEMGYELQQASLENNETFKAVYSLEDTRITLYIDNQKNIDYKSRIVNLNSFEEGGIISIDNPVFYDTQFNVKCMDYANRTEQSTSDILRWRFSILTSNYIVEYIIRTPLLEEATEIFSEIANTYE